MIVAPIRFLGMQAVHFVARRGLEGEMTQGSGFPSIDAFRREDTKRRGNGNRQERSLTFIWM